MISRTRSEMQGRLLMVPSSIYAYVVGKNALEKLDEES